MNFCSDIIIREPLFCMVLNRGFTIIKSLAVCAQKQEVTEKKLSHGGGHSAESYGVMLHKYASSAQTFTVYAPSEVSFCFVYCVSVLC